MIFSSLLVQSIWIHHHDQVLFGNDLLPHPVFLESKSTLLQSQPCTSPWKNSISLVSILLSSLVASSRPSSSLFPNL
jgi:hypothetical protein